MKVIVDTCVWSLSLRRRNAALMNPGDQQLLAQLREAIQDRRAVILGPIRQEILSGIRDKAYFAKTQELLDPFLDAEIRPADYIEAARLYNLCQDHGVRCGPIDILICAVAVQKQLEILTYDQGLLRCIEVLRAEGLMH
jgi:predicted nucleic acid-binding protein